MPLTKRSLVLPASPPSVKLARSWVSKILAEIGREDLVDAAQLGVSELVTNALIHSQPPLSGRVMNPRESKSVTHCCPGFHARAPAGVATILRCAASCAARIEFHSPAASPFGGWPC